MKKVEKLNKRIEKLNKRISRIEKPCDILDDINSSDDLTMMTNMGLFFVPLEATVIILAVLLGPVYYLATPFAIGLSVALGSATSEGKGEFLLTAPIEKICDFRIARAKKQISKCESKINEIQSALEEFNITDESGIDFHKAIKNLEVQEEAIKEKEDELTRMKVHYEEQKNMIAKMAKRKMDERTQQYNEYTRTYKSEQTKLQRATKKVIQESKEEADVNIPDDENSAKID